MNLYEPICFYMTEPYMRQVIYVTLHYSILIYIYLYYTEKAAITIKKKNNRKSMK